MHCLQNILLYTSKSLLEFWKEKFIIIAKRNKCITRTILIKNRIWSIFSCIKGKWKTWKKYTFSKQPYFTSKHFNFFENSDFYLIKFVSDKHIKEVHFPNKHGLYQNQNFFPSVFLLKFRPVSHKVFYFTFLFAF